MSIKVYLTKRYLKERQRNGRQKHRWALRWRDPATGEWKYENTGTADKTRAKYRQDAKWDELNGPVQPTSELALPPEPEPALEKKSGPTWQECKIALERAMQADNLRPSYVSDAVLMLESVRRMFPEATSPADVTPVLANEYKRRRAEGTARVQKTNNGKGRRPAPAAASPWTIRGDLSTLKAVFGKWLGKECGLLDPLANPFANVKPPRCDDPDVRIVSAQETADLFAWLGKRWNNWRMPLIYLEIAALIGWRATEIASMKADDILADGFIRVAAESSKTRRHKHGWLPPELHTELQECAGGGWAFGRFADELGRLLLLWKRRPNHAAKIKEFTPARMVAWLQDELQRYNAERTEAAAEADPPTTWEPFTLHDFRRTAITGMQMAGTSEKEVSVIVGATPEVIRRHYEKLDQLAIARRNVERRLGADGTMALRFQLHHSLRARCARGVAGAIDTQATTTQTDIA